MDMRELIELGNKKAGEQKALAALLHLAPTVLADAKAGRRGIPAPSCFLLAEYLGIDPARVIAASELVTEKNEERRKVFYPFVMGRAAMIATMSALIGATALPPESHASSGFMTPVCAKSSHYVKYRLRRFMNTLGRWFMIFPFSYAP